MEINPIRRRMRKHFTNVSIFLGLGVVSALLGVSDAHSRTNGFWVFGASVLVGLTAFSIDFMNTWRHGRLFISDRAEIARRQAVNRRMARALIVPSIALGAIIVSFPGLYRACFFAFIAGLMIPYSVFLFIHIVRHHEEIDRLTE